VKETFSSAFHGDFGVIGQDFKEFRPAESSRSEFGKICKRGFGMFIDSVLIFIGSLANDGLVFPSVIWTISYLASETLLAVVASGSENTSYCFRTGKGQIDRTSQCFTRLAGLLEVPFVS